jgi:hypothetical protein
MRLKSELPKVGRTAVSSAPPRRNPPDASPVVQDPPPAQVTGAH